MSETSNFFTADWPAPEQVHVVTTTRRGGVSMPPYDTFNLATHVGDQPEAVQQNRARLVAKLSLPSVPLWLTQVHGRDVATVPGAKEGVEADAAWTDQPGQVLAVLTADCLPVVICDHEGTQLAVVHAGWRGLVEGVLEAAVTKFSAAPENLLAWMGPAIGPEAFEVGPEVRHALISAYPANADAFTPGKGDRWMADIFLLARLQLGRLGVSRVFGGGRCTYSDPEHFYSYRRDGRTGRMATLAWLEQPAWSSQNQHKET